jgi:hypothetical protein
VQYLLIEAQIVRIPDHPPTLNDNDNDNDPDPVTPTRDDLKTGTRDGEDEHDIIMHGHICLFKVDLNGQRRSREAQQISPSMEEEEEEEEEEETYV